MFTWCRKRKADIIFLQETHSKEELENQWINEWGGKIIIDPQGRFIILKLSKYPG